MPSTDKLRVRLVYPRQPRFNELKQLGEDRPHAFTRGLVH